MPHATHATQATQAENERATKPPTSCGTTTRNVSFVIAAALMLCPAIICFGVACYTRHVIGIAAAAVMLAAMIDHALTHAVAPMLWAVLLLLAGVLVGSQLRIPADAPGVPPTRTGHPDRGVLNRAARLASALAFVAMAWSVLRPAPAASDASAQGSATNTHQHGSLAADGSVLVVCLGLAVFLLAVALLAVKRHHTVLSLDTGGMGLMLIGAVAV